MYSKSLTQKCGSICILQKKIYKNIQALLQMCLCGLLSLILQLFLCFLKDAHTVSAGEWRVKGKGCSFHTWVKQRVNRPGLWVGCLPVFIFHSVQISNIKCQCVGSVKRCGSKPYFKAPKGERYLRYSFCSVTEQVEHTGFYISKVGFYLLPDKNSKNKAEMNINWKQNTARWPATALSKPWLKPQPPWSHHMKKQSDP